MKYTKKLLAAVMVMVMALALCAVPAFAQEVDSQAGGSATITVNNAAKGETYKVFKIFNATQNDKSGEAASISYTGDIPTELANLFEKDAAGNIKTKTGVTDADIANAAKAWKEKTGELVSAVAGGDALVFTNLEYGYYFVTSTQGAAVTVTSTNPNASINDKNSKTPSATKEVEKQSYSIGDTVKYTATFDTANFMGEGANAKAVVEYVISDTLPEFLSDVQVTSIQVKEGEEVTNLTVQQFVDKKITIPWADKNGNTYTSKYKNGAQIIIKYQGTLTSVTNVNTADTNTVTIKPYVDNGNGGKEPWNDEWESSKEIKTYAAALKKVDENGQPLAGATFTFKGLTVTGSDGVYTVTSYDPNGAESAPLATDADGKLYIVGLASDVDLVVTEAVAPDGYNKLSGTKTLEPQLLSTKIYKEAGTIYYDADGNVVSQESSSTTSETVEANLNTLDAGALTIENQKGTELPSTGGMGTTIIYVIGGIMVLLAGVYLITKRRASKEEEL